MKVFEVTPKAQVYVYSKPISMSSSFPKLTHLVTLELNKQVKGGDLYLFVNKKRTYVKILFWSKDGVCILAKKLPRGVFNFKLEGQHLSIAGLQNVINKPDLKTIDYMG